MPEFYVEGHTAEGAPYGPVHVLTTPLEDGFEGRMSVALSSPSVQVPQGLDKEALRAFILQDAGQAREEESALSGAWREAVMLGKRDFKENDIG